MVRTPRRGVRKPISTAGKMPAGGLILGSSNQLCVSCGERLSCANAQEPMQNVLERGAPAPLSVQERRLPRRLEFGMAEGTQQPARTQPRLPMLNLLRSRVARAGTTAFVAALCERRLFSPARVQQDNPADTGQQYLAVTDRRYSTAGERSRARKGADGRILA